MVTKIKMGDTFRQFKGGNKVGWVFSVRYPEDGPRLIKLRHDQSLDGVNSAHNPGYTELTVRDLLDRWTLTKPNEHPSATVVWVKGTLNE